VLIKFTGPCLHLQRAGDGPRSTGDVIAVVFKKSEDAVTHVFIDHAILGKYD
jgi:hypothetical protein